MKRVRYHPIAREEYLATLRHYRFISLNLGQRFKTAYERALNMVRNWPESGRLMKGQVRRVLLGDGFSYGLFYVPHEDEIIILSVMSDKQDPTTWHERT